MFTLRSPEIPGGEQLSLVNGSELVRLDPLPMPRREVVDQQELVGVVDTVHSQGDGCTRAVDGDTSCLEVKAGVDDEGEGRCRQSDDGAYSQIKQGNS